MSSKITPSRNNGVASDDPQARPLTAGPGPPTSRLRLGPGPGGGGTVSTSSRLPDGYRPPSAQPCRAALPSFTEGEPTLGGVCWVGRITC